MGSENFRIDKYQWEVHQDVVHGVPRTVTLLYLYDQRRNLLAAVAFLPDDAPLAAPSEAPDGHVAVQLHVGDQPRIVDLLRNEKPVYFGWWPEAQGVRLATGKEPVGEHELRKLFSFLYV